LVSPFNLTASAALLPFGLATFAATVFNPPADRLACTFAVTGIDAIGERRGKTFTVPDVVRAERSNTCFLRFGQRYLDIALNLGQSLIPFNGVHLVGFRPHQLHTLYHRFTIHHCGATANCLDPATVFVS